MNAAHTKVRSNVAANFAGGVWTGVMSLIFIPLYIHFLGAEQYGLVGFFITLQGVLVLLDAGLSATLNREFARLSVEADARPVMRRLLRTLETIYWGVAVVSGAMIMLLAHWIAAKWVHPKALSVATIEQAVRIMGVAITMQWPLALYSGGLQGLQKQVTLNVLNVSAATLRGGGAVLILWLVSPTIHAFFLWQIVVALLHTLAAAAAVRWNLGGMSGARFERDLLRSIRNFAAGLTAIAVLSTVITQFDKIVLSRTLDLENFGYYAFAASVAASLYRIITPISTAVFPRFSQLVAAGDEQQLGLLYHKAAKAIALVVLPAGVFIAFFSREILLLWTRNAVTADRSHVVLSLLMMGTAFNGLLTIPYSAQLACGWTRLVIVMNSVAIALLIPTVLILSRRFGAPGAAVAWLVYNFSAAIVMPAIMHRRVLRGQLRRWYVDDVAIPLLIAVFVATVARLALRVPTGDIFSLVVFLLPVAALMQLATALGLRDVREVLLRAVRAASG